MKLNDQQVLFLENEIRERGITLPELGDELLDHFCCAIEQEAEAGSSFEDAYRKVYLKICPDGLREIEWETKLVVTQNNYSIMKKAVFVLGFLSAFVFLVGFNFKMMHWPTANLQIMLGGWTFGLIFLPSYYVMKYLTDKEMGRASSGWVYILNSLMVCTIVSAVPYAFAHWPGAVIFKIVGFFLLAFVFLPRVFMGWYKKFTEGSMPQQHA